MNKTRYLETVKLLLEILPYALKDKRFALKGGTAINLFHRDFTRLSVDIDLCYLPIEDRKTTFKNIHQILSDIKKDLESKLNLNVISNNPLDGKKEAKLIARNQNTEVKIEPNYTLRGSLFKPELIELSKKAQDEFQKTVEVQCLGLADTFGGKICAALDRQHPRDLFDVKKLLENEGVNKDIKDSFILYLLSHSRPVDEILSPNLKEITKEYEKEFVSMAQIDASLSELIIARLELIKTIHQSLTDGDKNFLKSFVEGNPDWNLVRDSKIKDFPSVKWKLFNQDKMSAKRRKEYLKKTFEVLSKSF